MKYSGLHKLDDLIFSVNKPIIGKKGIHYQKLLKDWRLIVGDYLANCTIPTKISSIRKQNSTENVLYVAANNSATAAELVYQIGVIKEQVNFYFGYDYIAQIKCSQAVFKTATPDTIVVAPKITKSQEEKLEVLTSEYEEDDEIKRILISLATSMLQRR